MRNMRNIVAAISATALMALVPTVTFATSAYMVLGHGDMANGEKIFKNGKGEVPACVSCHGDDGTGNDDMGTPRLAGQTYPFLLKQLEDFAADRRQDLTMMVMNFNAKGLTPQDRKDVATYLSSLKHPAGFKGSDLEALKKAGTAVGVEYKGREIVEYGSPTRNDGFPKELGAQGPGVAACKSCHGVAGRGAPPIFPMIGQQRYVYIVNQLKHLRDGTRANDPMGAMRAIAKKLSDEDIENAAAYLTQASPIAPGESQNPYDHYGPGEE
jgi:cytochrome c553